MQRFSLRARYALGLAVVSALFVAGCSPAQPSESVDSGAQKVATFDGGEVTQGQVDEQVETLSGAGGAGAEAPEPGTPQYEQLQAQVVPQLVDTEIAKVYAEEHGITVSDEEVEEEMDGIRAQVGEQAAAAGEDVNEEEAFQQALEQAGFTEEQLREDIRENLPVQKVQEEVVGDEGPTEEEVEEYYEENREAQYTTPEQRCARHILFPPDAEEEAEDVREELEDGGDFAALAEENSQDPGSAEQGGDLGCLGEGETAPEFDAALFEAEEGDLVGPVETEFGFHLIELQEIQPEEEQPLEDVAPEIEQQLAQQEQGEAFQAWLEDQREQRNVSYLEGYDPEEQPEDPGVAPPEGGAQPEPEPEGEPEPEE